MKTSLILSVLCLLPVVGCASGPSRTDVRPAAVDVEETARQVRIVTGGGSPATWDDLVKAASEADAVLSGENHGHPLGLAAAAALWEDLLAGRPQGVLAMEFLERDEQSRVDDCIAGITDVDGLATVLRRDEQGLPKAHRRMISLARAGGRPVIAANAPRRYVRVARSQGYDRLRAFTDEQRRLFRIPDAMPQGAYRAAFDDVMNTNAGITAEQLADPAFAADDERLARELALFADRSDITEELSRLESHLKQFGAGLSSKDANGRSLDFLAQEMFRECNTIGSKANSAAVTRHVIAAKTELERLREQVQNVE